MAFVFRLESVLRHRRHLEDEAALAFARAQDRLGALRGRLTGLAAEAAATRQALGERADQGSTGADLARLANGLEEIYMRSALCAAEVAAQVERVERARQDLVEATRARRILERLEETARAEHARHEAVLEQRQTDEVATSGQLWRRAHAPVTVEEIR